MDEPQPIDRTGRRRARLVGAAVGMLAALTIGGAGLAWAQETPTTEVPTTEAPAPEAPADTGPGGRHRPGDCPEKDGAGGGGGGGSSSTDSIADDTSV